MQNHLINSVTDEETNQALNDVPMTTLLKSPLTGEEILTHHKNAKKRLKRRRCKNCCCITPIILVLALIVGIPLGIWIHAKGIKYVLILSSMTKNCEKKQVWG